MGKEKIRTEIEFIPARIKVIDYYRESFQCLACGKDSSSRMSFMQMRRPCRSTKRKAARIRRNPTCCI